MQTKSVWNGKEINLTTDNINITSDNSKIGTDGTIEVLGGSNNGTAYGLHLRVVEDAQNYRYSGLAPQFGIIRNNKDTYINAQVGSVNNPTQQVANMELRASNDGASISLVAMGSAVSGIALKSSSGTSYVNSYGIRTPTLTQTSKATEKKNFEKLENALEIVKQTDIYKYNLKYQKDGEKKHIGFVIGEGFKHSKDITSEDVDGNEIGVDLYTMVSVLWKAVQEQQTEIEQFKTK